MIAGDDKKIKQVKGIEGDGGGASFRWSEKASLERENLRRGLNEMRGQAMDLHSR